MAYRYKVRVGIPYDLVGFLLTIYAVLAFAALAVVGWFAFLLYSAGVPPLVILLLCVVGAVAAWMAFEPKWTRFCARSNQRDFERAIRRPTF